MATDITFTNTYIAYWSNEPYNYPVTIQDNRASTASNFSGVRTNDPIRTGWHILPLSLWRHFTTPKQWVEFVIGYEAYTVKGFECTVYNPVPMTQQLAIQGTTTFTAFNNTIYSLGCSDDLYETSWHNWNNPNDPFRNFSLAYKEGVFLVPKSSETTREYRRTMLPVYSWTPVNSMISHDMCWTWDLPWNSYPVWPFKNAQSPTNTYQPDGVFWDPLCSPDDIMELRPGKNSMTWSWNTHDCDQNKWFNIDQIAKWIPYVHDNPFVSVNQSGGPGSYITEQLDDPAYFSTPASNTLTTTAPRSVDYTIPNLADVPVVPTAWFWQEMQKSIDVGGSDGFPSLFFAGTEYEQYKYGMKQCFIKGLPLFDDNNTHVSTTTQGCIRVSLHLAAKKRRSRIFAPTWGPLPWRLTHSIHTGRIGSYVRYRTGGARRTWTNRTNEGEQPAPRQHRQRRVPYSTGQYTSTTTTRTTTTAATMSTMSTEPK